MGVIVGVGVGVGVAVAVGLGVAVGVGGSGVAVGNGVAVAAFVGGGPVVAPARCIINSTISNMARASPTFCPALLSRSVNWRLPIHSVVQRAPAATNAQDG